MSLGGICKGALVLVRSQVAVGDQVSALLALPGLNQGITGTRAQRTTNKWNYGTWAAEAAKFWSGFF